MLFAAKNHLSWTFLALGFLLGVSYGLHFALELPWKWSATLEQWQIGALLAAAVAASDGLVHALMRLVFGHWYQSRYRALVEYCRPQRAWHIAASGLLAAGEEVFFRGTLLEWLFVQHVPIWPAIVVVAILFATANAIPRREFWPFWIWATWEGVLLGAVYYFSGSLLISAVVHGLHDIAGFALFSYQRRTRWLL